MPTARPDNYSIPSGGTLSAGGLLGAVASPLTVGHYLATPEQITFNCPLSRPLADGTAVRLYYKLPLSTNWLEAHPLLYVRAAEVTSGGPTTPVDACKGAIFDLVPGQTYDWKIVGTEPGVGTWEGSGQRATRELPPAAGAPTVNATTASNLQILLNALTPGAVLQLANGTYTLSTFLQISAAGTESQPIYIRGQSRDGVILARAAGVAVQVYTGAYTVIENLTIQGSGTDSGTASTSVGIEFWAGGAAQQGITIRDVKMTGVDKGVSTINARQALVYNCDLAGNNTWALAYQDNGGQTNLTWNDDGMLLAGEGNCCWATKLDGFGDATASGHASSGGRANFFYRLEIPMTGDDGHEFDYTDGPCAFYDCRIGNSATVASWQPTFGGPAFAFRNVAANSIRGPWKLNDVNAGALIYCNTVVRTPGATGFGLYQSGQGGAYFQRSMSHRGNLYALRGSPTEVLRFDSLCDRLDWTHNGYTQDGSFDWAASGGGVTASLAAARAALPTRATLFGTGQRHANDIIVSSANPWTETVTLGADHTTRFTGFPSYVLAGGSNALGAGVHIPGITDGYSGAAPALGAVIPGRALVAYGVPVLPTWVPASSNTQANVTTLTAANGRLANNAASVCAPYYDAYRFPTIFNAYSGGAFNPYWGTHGAMHYYGTGHSAGNDNTVPTLVLGEVCNWRRLNDPSPIYGTGTDATTQGNNSFASFSGLPYIDPPTCTYPVDGQAAGQHSYGNTVMLPPTGSAPQGRLFTPLVTAATKYDPPILSAVSANRIDITAALGSSAMKWVHMGVHPTLGYGAALNPSLTAPTHAAYDAPRNRTLFVSRQPGPVRWYDHTADAYVDGTGTGLDASDFGTIAAHVLVNVPQRSLLLIVYRKTGGTTLGIKWMDLSAAQPAWVNTGATLSATINVDADWSAACWCVDNSRVLVGDLQANRGAYYEIEIPATLSSTWTCTQVTMSQDVTTFRASGSRTSDNATDYGKWAYVPALKCVMHFNHHHAAGAADTVFAIRPRGV